MAGADGQEEGMRAGRREVGRVRKPMEPLKGCRGCSAQMSEPFRLTVTHRQGGRAGTGLGLDDLCGVSARRGNQANDARSHSESVPTVTAELDALHEVLVLLSLDVLAQGGLAEERNNGDTRVAADDGDLDVLGVGVLDLAEEARGTDDVEGGDTEEAARAKERARGRARGRAMARETRGKVGESGREWERVGESGRLSKAGPRARRRKEDENEDRAKEVKWTQHEHYNDGSTTERTEREPNQSRANPTISTMPHA